MDEDRIDKELTDHIRGVFDDYEDPTANEGWLLLRERYPEKEKDRGLAWPFWYAAAALLVVIAGLWFLRKPDTGTAQHLSVIKKTAGRHQQSNAAGQQKINRIDTATGSHLANNSATVIKGQNQTGIIDGPATITGQTNSPNGNKPANAAPNNQLASANNPTGGNQRSVSMPVPATSGTGLPSNTLPGKNGDLITGTLPVKVQPDVKTVQPADSPAKAQYATTNPVKAQPQPDHDVQSASALTRLLTQTAPDTKKPTDKTSKKTIIGVYAATYFNYAKGSDNRLNMGAGLSSDFKLSKKLRLSTGLAIGQNTLNYTSDLSLPTAIAMADFKFSQSNTAFSAALTSGSSGTPGQVKKDYSASLIGLDIPINLKFQFNPEKSDTYVAAGLSSGTFINETYTNVYSYGQTTQQSTATKSFSGFDVAKTLNVSFGMGYPLGKSNRLVIEPFLKYPLDGLGSQQIKFGAGGVNLKLNFIPGKKSGN